MRKQIDSNVLPHSRSLDIERILRNYYHAEVEVERRNSRAIAFALR